MTSDYRPAYWYNNRPYATATEASLAQLNDSLESLSRVERGLYNIFDARIYPSMSFIVRNAEKILPMLQKYVESINR